MKRIAVVLALGLSGLAGSAGADTLAFQRTALPSAEAPNLPGSIVLPAAFTTPPATAQQRSFPQLHSLWRRAGTAYGIPWPVLASINKVESNFGRNMGPSSAGAVGWMQFMPSTWLRWGMDGDGDGIADPWNPEDAVFSAARYLAAAGGRFDLPRAVYAYNHAQWYVDEVLEVARLFEAGGPEGAFTLDRLQVSLGDSEREVAAASEAIVRAERVERRFARIERKWLARADRARLLSDRLALRKLAVQAGVRRDRAAGEAAAARARVSEAEGRLATLRERARAASFAGGAAALLGAPSFDGDYVFPVGGGPGVVSVGHDHHDYPAADIAAPAGAPVYALSAAIVREVLAQPSGSCGIGLTLQTQDGLQWTYCHLSYLEPGLEAGAFLSAGTAVGLVGSTGHSTGPHLHLQLQPPTAYPQEQQWFRAFAGSAFTWQDGPDAGSDVTPRVPVPAHPVFAVKAPADGAIPFTR